MRNIVFQARDVRTDIIHESGTAGRRQKALFNQLLRFVQRSQVRAQRRFNAPIEPKLQQSGKNHADGNLRIGFVL